MSGCEHGRRPRNLLDWAAGRLRGKFQAILRERAFWHLTYRERLVAAWRNRHVPYEIVSFDEIRRRRASETLFVIGSGPSVLDVSDRQWKYVAGCESFGINFSFLLDVVPTYHVMEDPKEGWLRKLHADLLAPRRQRLGQTIWFISERQRPRGIHPRLTPELFPTPARVCVYRFPGRLLLERDRAFVPEDFERSIRYRGTMSLVLHFAVELGYRRIVLLGVDLHSSRHFFDGMEEIKPYVDTLYPDPSEAERPYALMRPQEGMFRPMDEYLYALNELFLSWKNIKLYIGNRDNLLCPRIPYFAEWDE